MKNFFKRTSLTLLIFAILLSIAVLATNGSKMIEAFYTGIKLYVDGAEYVPTDANGNVVEPFIYNGTTYLPVRAVANAFKKDVVWDGKTQSVYLGKKNQNQPDAYLNEIQYSDFRKGAQYGSIAIINGELTDYNNNIYKDGLLFGVRNSGGGAKESWCEIDYPLNSQYKTLCGTIVLPKTYPGAKKEPRVDPTTVYIYDADTDTELFKINGVVASMPYKFEVDVRGVNKIKVRVEAQADNIETNMVALTGLALYK